MSRWFATPAGEGGVRPSFGQKARDICLCVQVSHSRARGDADVDAKYLSPAVRLGLEPYRQAAAVARAEFKS